jgi:LPS sulfotransferase NodH
MSNPIALAFPYSQVGRVSGARRSCLAGTKNYVVAMTPRSGSAWLGDLLSSTIALGRPDEWFNPEVLEENARQFGTLSLLEYVDHIRREFSSSDGVFGMQISFFHLKSLEELRTIELLFGRMPVWFYLRRRNLVAQGVSLYLATESGYWHSFQRDEALLDRFNSLEYDAEKIMFWCRHVVDQEEGFCAYFNSISIEPVRLWYEDIVQDPITCVRLFCNIMNILSPCAGALDSKLERTSGERNLTWEARFRDEAASLVSDLEQRRAQAMGPLRSTPDGGGP